MQVKLPMSIEKGFDRLALVRREVAGDHLDLFASRLISHDVVRNATNSAEVWRAAVLPSTSPVLVLKAAYKESVPWR
jgi:hypothetical protein